MKCGVSARIFEHVIVLLVPRELEFFAVVRKDFCLPGESCSVGFLVCGVWRWFLGWMVLVLVVFRLWLKAVNTVQSVTAGWQRRKAGAEAAAESPRCFCGDPCIVRFPRKDAESLFCCADCWPVSRLLSVGVPESPAHSLLSWFFMATTGLVGAKTKVMLNMKRSYLR